MSRHGSLGLSLSQPLVTLATAHATLPLGRCPSPFVFLAAWLVARFSDRRCKVASRCSGVEKTTCPAKGFAHSALLDPTAMERARMRVEKEEGVACQPWWLPVMLGALVVQSHSAALLNISISARCVARWNQAVDRSLGNVNISDPNVRLSGLNGWHQGKLYKFDRSVLFIHVGKAGGSSIAGILGATHVHYDQIHVHPVPLLALHSHPYIVITVRDPVARLISAYNWGISLRQPWAMKLSACYDVDQFAMAFAYHRINPSFRSARTPCDTLSDKIDAWTSTEAGASFFDFGHIRMDGCFYLGGCIGDSALLSKRMFVVRTEMISADAHAMLNWLNASELQAPPHKNENLAARNATQLRPFAQHALEVALVDEYQLVNRIMQMSINAPQSAYCVTYADIHGLRCNDMM